MSTEYDLHDISHCAYRAQQIRENEATAAAQKGKSMYQLMQKAGQDLFEITQQRFPFANKYAVIVGKGNNAGDGFIAALHARNNSKDVIALTLFGDAPLSQDAEQAKSAWLDSGGQIQAFDIKLLNDTDIIIDAIFGSGLNRTLDESICCAIKALNDLKLPVISVDVPSGMQADTGMALPICIQATITITMVGIKTGLITGAGKQYSGEVLLSSLDINDAFQGLCQPSAFLFAYENLPGLPPRKVNSHKSNYGRLLCIGGNRGMSGAIRLASEAAMRAGVGMVKVYTHQSSLTHVANGRPELMIDYENFEQALCWSTCVVLGPGLGTDDWAKEVFNAAIEHCRVSSTPLLIDADGLNLLASSKYDLSELPVVITPHSGEASRLLNISVDQIESDRYEAARACATKYGTICVLKGPGSLITDGQQTFVCRNGNPALAVAGTGDVLSGTIGALMAQSLSPINASKMGVAVHAKAGDIQAERYGQRGMLASDLFTTIRKLVN